jgi:cbb3-type cytochrome oxidase subunit 3
MMAFLHHMQWLSHYSVAVMMAVFLLIIGLTYWPSRKSGLERQGRIPFKDDV